MAGMYPEHLDAERIRARQVALPMRRYGLLEAGRGGGVRVCGSA
jgi:hypothetical protein